MGYSARLVVAGLVAAGCAGWSSLAAGDPCRLSSERNRDETRGLRALYP
jgi:hypothetical protein